MSVSTFPSSGDDLVGILADSSRKSLSSDEAHALRVRLVSWFIQSLQRSEGRLVLDKLCSTLATYFIQTPVPWGNALAQLICSLYEERVVSDEEASSHQASLAQVISQLPDSKLYPALRFCNILSEDVATKDHLSPQHRHLEGLMKGDVPNAAVLMHRGLSTTNSDIQSETLQTLTNWTGYAQAHWPRDVEGLLHLQKLTNFAMQYLTLGDQDLRDKATEVFTQILEYHLKFLLRDQLDALCNMICNNLGPHCISSIRNEEADPSVISSAKLMTAFGKATVQRLVEAPSDNTTQQLLDLFQQALQGPGYPGDDDECTVSITEFWNDYAEYVVDALEESSSYSDLPWLETSKDRLMRATESYLPKLCSPPTEVFRNWDEDTQESWSSFREDVWDFLQRVVVVPGTDLLAQLVNYALHSLQSKQYLDLEAAIYSLNAVADSVPISDDRSKRMIATLMESSLFAEMADPSLPISIRTKRTVMRLLESYSTFIQSNAQILPSVLTFLLSTMQTAPVSQMKLADAAAKSLKSLCSSCRRSLTAHLGELLQQSPQATSGPSANAYQKEKVMTALACIIQALPNEEAKGQALSLLLEMVERDLNNAVDYINRGAIEDGELAGTSALQYLAGIGEGMQDSGEHTVVDVEEEEDIQWDGKAQQDAYNFWNGEVGQAIQQRILNCFNIVDHLHNQGDAIDAACSVLRTGLTETVPGPFVFPPAVIAGFISKARLNTPRVEAMLITACAFVSAKSRSGVQRPVTEVYKIYEAMVTVTRELDQPGNDPGLAEICIDLMERLIPRYVDVLLAPADEEVAGIFNFVLRCVVGEAPMLKRRAATFLTSFIDLTGPKAPKDLPPSRIAPSAIMAEIGPLLAAALMNEIGGNAQRSELDSICKPLRSFIFTQPAAKRHLEQALISPHFPSQKVIDADKRVFLQKVTMLRGGRQTNVVVKEFWAVCKGTVSSFE